MTATGSIDDPAHRGHASPVGGPGPAAPARRVLVMGWSSFEDGEAGAGDVLAMRAVSEELRQAGIRHETAWSSVMCPPGGLRLSDVDPGRYSDVVFTCGPLAGPQVEQVHRRFAGCRRIAVDVSTIAADSAAAVGFHHVIARDSPTGEPRRDLACLPVTSRRPVVGVYLTHGQGEYGTRRRHEAVTQVVDAWLRGVDAALLDLASRLDPRDWRLPSTPEHMMSVLDRLDAVVTMRMHGLVLGLGAGRPVLAIDPVEGGAKVTAQARAWRWPCLVPAADVEPARLQEHLDWCLSQTGREAALTCASETACTSAATGSGSGSARSQLQPLMQILGAVP